MVSDNLAKLSWHRISHPGASPKEPDSPADSAVSLAFRSWHNSEGERTSVKHYRQSVVASSSQSLYNRRRGRQFVLTEFPIMRTTMLRRGVIDARWHHSLSKGDRRSCWRVPSHDPWRRCRSLPVAAAKSCRCRRALCRDIVTYILCRALQKRGSVATTSALLVVFAAVKLLSFRPERHSVASKPQVRWCAETEH